MPDEVVSAEALVALLDTWTVTPERMSCISAALREARSLVGRRPEDGNLADPRRGMTWAGALVHLIYCEQVGSCFRPSDSSRPRRGCALQDGLSWFGGFEPYEAEALAELRNRLAHDYTLRSPHPDGSGFALHGSSREPVCAELQGRRWAIGLPALAIRIETTFNTALLLLADEGQLLCHHRGGIQEVEARFFMSMLEAGPMEDTAGPARS